MRILFTKRWRNVVCSINSHNVKLITSSTMGVVRGSGSLFGEGENLSNRKRHIRPILPHDRNF